MIEDEKGLTSRLAEKLQITKNVDHSPTAAKAVLRRQFLGLQ